MPLCFSMNGPSVTSPLRFSHSSVGWITTFDSPFLCSGSAMGWTMILKPPRQFNIGEVKTAIVVLEQVGINRVRRQRAVVCEWAERSFRHGHPDLFVHVPAPGAGHGI